MRPAWLVFFAACGAVPVAPVANKQPAPRPLEPTAPRAFLLEGLGPELFGPNPIYARATDDGRAVACVTDHETTKCGMVDHSTPFARIELTVMNPELAHDMASWTEATRDAHADDLKRIRHHIAPSSRALTQFCRADGPVACDPLGLHAKVDAKGHVSLSWSGEIQGELDICDDVPASPSHAEVLADQRANIVVIVATASCGFAGFVMMGR
jgi:hypothetical protein